MVEYEKVVYSKLQRYRVLHLAIWAYYSLGTLVIYIYIYILCFADRAYQYNYLSN